MQEELSSLSSYPGIMCSSVSCAFFCSLYSRTPHLQQIACASYEQCRCTSAARPRPGQLVSTDTAAALLSLDRPHVTCITAWLHRWLKLVTCCRGTFAHPHCTSTGASWWRRR